MVEMDCLIVTIVFFVIGISVGYLISHYFYRKGETALQETNKEVDVARFAAEHGTTTKVVKDAGLYDGEERESNPKP